MIHKIVLSATLAAAIWLPGVASFAPYSKNDYKLEWQIERTVPATSLSMSKQFDISKPSFDLLSLRGIRGDALVRYDALNQSEPLRITLFAILALSFCAAPSLTEAVGYDYMSLPTTIGSYTLAIANVGLLSRECTRRSKQLSRIEKELNTESLPIRIPTNALADNPLSKPVTLQALRGLPNPPRIIAVSGNKEKLNEALLGLSILGRRFQQATVYIVVVPTDGSKSSDLDIVPSSSTPWLADAYNQGAWQEYFRSLSDSHDRPKALFQWFGLNSSGRSFGSGEDYIPLWLQVLGQHLRPTELLDDGDPAFASADAALLKSMDSFYSALTTGDREGIENIFSSTLTGQVSEVIDAGGRIDVWKDCLVDGARPDGMKISGADAVVVSETEAFTTVIEFPPDAGIDSATLLAVQKWSRENNGGDWKLDLHQTIPWSPDAKAQGTLLCDCRGCVALTRGPERRTFGGIIG